MPYIFLKETAAERWHPHAVLLFFGVFFCFLLFVFFNRLQYMEILEHLSSQVALLVECGKFSVWSFSGSYLKVSKIGISCSFLLGTREEERGFVILVSVCDKWYEVSLSGVWYCFEVAQEKGISSHHSSRHHHNITTSCWLMLNLNSAYHLDRYKKKKNKKKKNNTSWIVHHWSIKCFACLTLVLLNKLRCHTLFKFSANQIA